ncbi:hypothetical protein EOS93_01460 [Rhizobium sp. RMa-01]|uniref:hypothetical protein n=1 Tax=unclassified Rhizobium TaxID=2613769 RepID=UPI0008DAFC25|nr:MULTISPECIES: hypothetical protein [unclassified Rhizobium]OHV23527.1 hypothetical protein BBJ66_07680 [Rhizobium sp. RSm-3]RVU13530.1 hypothetical protein EOS93_01460 [Rhizobium sp. RMa-01]
MPDFETKARRDLSDSLLALWLFVLTHVVAAKALRALPGKTPSRFAWENHGTLLRDLLYVPIEYR